VRNYLKSVPRFGVTDADQSAVFAIRDQIYAKYSGSIGLACTPNGVYYAQWDATPDASGKSVRVVGVGACGPLDAIRSLRDELDTRVAEGSMQENGIPSSMQPIPLSDPDNDENAVAIPCMHEWRSAGFDPNGDNRGLHLFCTRCGKVVIPKPDENQPGGM